VGISQTLIVNVCQDSNRDGMCNIGEIQAKVTINKGDSVDDIWRKIALNSDGQYFLETYNPEFPILLELQDTSKVDYDNGKFTLAFDGFQTNEQNETKEISVLESMVDADAISKAEADSFRTLTNAEAQEKFYNTLLSDLETNINTLRRDGLDSKRAVTATIKEMGDETKANQEIADKINSCGDDQSCVDEEIKKVSDELIITEKESNPIIQPTATPTPTPEPTTVPVAGGEEVVYGKWVKPSKSNCKSNGGFFHSDGFIHYYDEDGKEYYNEKYYNECNANWKNAKSICNISGDVLPNIKTLRNVIINCGGNLNKNDIENEAYKACYKEKGFTSNNYWSSTTYALDSIYALTGDFFYSEDNHVRVKTHELHVRCVRGGQ
jgi:hypothetical protein